MSFVDRVQELDIGACSIWGKRCSRPLFTRLCRHIASEQASYWCSTEPDHVGDGASQQITLLSCLARVLLLAQQPFDPTVNLF
jgi:hypothetical protein